MGYWSKRKKKRPRSEEEALKYVRRLLRYRLRSEKEIERRLDSEGFPADVVHSVVGELKEAGLIDDRRFAYMFARSELEVSFHGPYLIRRKLKGLEVDDDVIEEALRKALGEFDPTDHVKRLYERYKDLKKVKEILYRRGFDPSIIEDTELEIDRR